MNKYDKDLLIDFITWLSYKKIYLVDITNNKDQFVTDDHNLEPLTQIVREYLEDEV